MTTKQQAYAWWVGFALLVALHGLCLPRGVKEVGQRHSTGRPASRPRALTVAAWSLLSAAGCAALLATTNVITFDVASVPLLWVLPLSVYLLTYVLAFKARPWLPR